jgi:hypothetical protein
MQWRGKVYRSSRESLSGPQLPIKGQVSVHSNIGLAGQQRGDLLPLEPSLSHER